MPVLLWLMGLGLLAVVIGGWDPREPFTWMAVVMLLFVFTYSFRPPFQRIEVVDGGRTVRVVGDLRTVSYDLADLDYVVIEPSWSLVPRHEIFLCFVDGTCKNVHFMNSPFVSTRAQRRKVATMNQWIADFRDTTGSVASGGG